MLNNGKELEVVLDKYTVAKHFELFKEASGGNHDAYAYLIGMAKAARVWDDAYDQDRPINKEMANDAFSCLSFEFSRNPFFMKNQEVLTAFSFLCWNAWMDSNEWKQSMNPLMARCAWFIRDFFNEIVPLVAWLTGGKELARNLSLKSRELFLNRLAEQGSDGFGG